MVLYQPPQGRTLHGLVTHLSTFADHPTLCFIARRCPWVSSRAPPLAKGSISGLEQGIASQHGVHDDSEAASERYPSLPQATPLRDS